MKYDHTDRRIIAALRENSTRRLLAYTARTGIPKSTLHERLHKLFASGVQCVPIIDWSKAGFGISVLFLVPYDEQLVHHVCVNSAQHLAPNLLLLECVFRSIKDVEEFKEHINAARYFGVIDVLKKEGFVPEGSSHSLILKGNAPPAL